MKNDVVDYLEAKYNDTFYVDETISPGIDVRYYEYYCHSSQYPDRKFVVYKKDGEYRDNYFSVLIYQQYVDVLNSVLTDYFDDFKVYIRFLSDFFDNDFVEVNKWSEYLKENSQQFFVDIFIYTDDENAKEIKINSLTNKLKNEFINYYISLNLVDEETLKTVKEDTYLSVDRDNYYTNTIK